MKTFAISSGIISLIAGMLFAILLLLLYWDNPKLSFYSAASVKIGKESPLTRNSDWPAQITQQPPAWHEPYSYRLKISGTRGSDDVIVLRVESLIPGQAQGLANFMASRFATNSQFRNSATEELKLASDPSLFTISTLLFWIQLSVCFLIFLSGVLLVISGAKQAKA